MPYAGLRRRRKKGTEGREAGGEVRTAERRRDPPLPQHGGGPASRRCMDSTFEAGVSMACIPKGGQALRLSASKVDGGKIRYEADDVVPHRRERGRRGRQAVSQTKRPPTGGR